MIIQRLLVRVAVLPWIAMTGGLVLMFASYSITRYLAQAAQGALEPGVVTQMIGLRL